MSARASIRIVSVSLLGLLPLCGVSTPGFVNVRAAADTSKLGPLARQRAALSSGRSTVILHYNDPAAVRSAVIAAGGTVGRTLSSISGQVATVPNAALNGLSSSAAV